MAWPCFKVFWFSKDSPTGHNERIKKKRQIEEEVEGNIKEWTGRTLPAQLGQLKTGQDGKGLVQIHLWCPNDLPRLWVRIEKNVIGKKNNQTSVSDSDRESLTLGSTNNAGNSVNLVSGISVHPRVGISQSELQIQISIESVEIKTFFRRRP